MKKLLLIVVFFICQNVFCQEYYFDRVVQYKETSQSFTGERFITIFFNSKNSSYHFVNQSWGSQINAYLVDINLNTTHNFYIDNINNSKDYNYLDSKKFNPDNCEIDCSKSTLEETKNLGEFTKITYNEFTTKKKKRLNYKMEVIAKPTDFICLKTIIQVLQHHFLFCEELKTSESSLPFSAKFIRGNKIYSEQKLEKVSNIDMNFSVKKELIKYKTTN